MNTPFFLKKARHYILLCWGILTTEVWIYLALTTLSVFLLFHFVNLQPEVTDEFFFSSEDEQFQSEHEISKLFVRNDQQVIISVTGPIYDEEYQEKIFDLTEVLHRVEGVTGVTSLTHGPNNFKDAAKSPLWKRLIVSDDKKSTNLILFIDDLPPVDLIMRLEKVMSDFSADDFLLRAAGLPYIVELIRRSLLHDLKTFSSIAFIVFGIIIFSIFRSKAVLVGTLISCINACVLTFMISHLLKIPIGILTANLGTIICILTLSHIIFLTFNWKHLCSTKTVAPIAEAMRITFSPSFWSMLTTLLGFLSLLSVKAKPLRDLGASGAIGTVMAIAVAYAIFPAFLKMARRTRQLYWAKHHSFSERVEFGLFRFLDKRNNYVVLTLLIICLLAIPGLWMIDSDPSLLAYFAPKSEIHQGLDYIDRNGGSSPLVMVIKKNNHEQLLSKDSYLKLWELQEDLESHRSVGSVISLPVLLAQAKKAPLAFLLSWKRLVSILEQPEYDAIAKSFISEDHCCALFLLRMREAFRTLPRLNIVHELEAIVRTHGFTPALTGGIYVLQGHLAKLVAISLVMGLGKLLVLFAIIGFIVSRSLRITLALTLSIALLPVTILGLIGLYRIPLDVISAPASNIAIAIGIDSMIHMIKAYRRLGDWGRVKRQLWQPIMTAMTVISIGFSIFLVSSFPPTQRFGLAIVIGTIIAGLTALFIMPFFISIIKFDKLPFLSKPVAQPRFTAPPIEDDLSEKIFPSKN